MTRAVSSLVAVILMIITSLFGAAAENVNNGITVRDSSSRKNPVMFGEVLEKQFTVTYRNAEAYDVTYKARIWISELYRGNAAERFLSGKRANDLKRRDHERVIARVNVEFVSIENLGPKSTTDDPKIEFSYFGYAATGYSGSGSEYYDANYVDYDDTLKDLYEGGSSDAYYWFEVDKEDEAPRFHVETEYLGIDDWFSLVGPESETIEETVTSIDKDGLTYEPVDYDALARTPEEYELRLIYFTGKVIQVIEEADESVYRVAIDSDADRVMLVHYPRAEDNVRILKNDIVSVYGMSEGLESYQSTLGGKITIPGCTAISIEIDQ